MIKQIGKKKFLIIELEDEIANLSDERCLAKVIEELSKNVNVDGIILVKEDEYIVEDESFKLIKEYVNEILKTKNKELISKITNPKEVIKKAKKKKIKLKSKLANLLNKKSYEEIFSIYLKPRFILPFIKLDYRGKVIDEYKVKESKVKIIEEKDQLEYTYFIEPRELNLSYKEINDVINCLEKLKILEIKGEISYLKDKERGIKKIAEIFKINQNVASVVYRYSFGFGVLENLMDDEKIQDIYVDSPGNKEVYIFHEKYGLCKTNIILGEREIERLASKFRIISGRPFDEAYPVIDLQLPNNIRVCSITEPLTFKGKGIAFRKHKQVPFTLSYLVKENYMSKDAAGLLSFLVDSNITMLISGVRSSGKTSLLSSLLIELKPIRRIIVIEDTPELQVNLLRKFNYKIEHLKVRMPLFEGYELKPKDALLASLRLGESVLVIGEVRGEEASYLFEAMRIGATGSSVLGTIHGSSVIDVYDRIVNDLKVPSSSFKAVDVILLTSLLQFKEKRNRYRRLIEINEVRKNWLNNPFKEKGIFNLAYYNRNKDKLLLRNLSKSELIRRIIKEKGLSKSEILKEIKIRGELKKELSKHCNLDEKSLAREIKANILLSKRLEKNLNVSKDEIKKIIKNSINSLS